MFSCGFENHLRGLGFYDFCISYCCSPISNLFTKAHDQTLNTVM